MDLLSNEGRDCDAARAVKVPKIGENWETKI